MKKYFKYLLLIIAFAFMFIITGCESEINYIDITFDLDNGSDPVVITIEENTAITVENAPPTKYGYDFSGWFTEDGKPYSEFSIFSDPITFKAKWTAREYTITFENDDFSVIETKKGFYGEEIEFPANPTKASTNTTVYTFEKWIYKSNVIDGDMTITASYTSSVRKYKITFEDANGNIIQSNQLEYEAIPTPPAENPTKESDSEYDYTFKGWTPAIINVDGDAAYAPEFEAVAKSKTRTTLEGAKISILGDSISTFYDASSTVNSYYSESGRYYYPTYCASVKKVEQTWWHQLITTTKMNLGINNSWSGSTAYGTSGSCGMNDARLSTLDENGNPDIVIVYLGTNDSASIYEDTYTLANYKSALETIVDYIKTNYNSDIFFIELCGKHGFKNGTYLPRAFQFNEVIEEVAEDNGCGIIPIQEYVDKDNDDIYLNDNLHFNLKGTTLLAKVCEKYMKEFYGIKFDEQITVEYPEKLPEGIVAYASATANKGFWSNNNYVSNVYLSSKTDETSIPRFSYKIYIKKNANDNKYYVSAIDTDNSAISDYDYIYYISSSHTNYSEIKGQTKNVAVGNLVEFDDTFASFPLTITFKEGTTTPVTPPVTPDEPTEDTPMYKDGVLHIGKYNSGVWTDYDKAIIAYSYTGLTDKSSLYTNFYVVSLTKDTGSDNYKVTYLKNVGESMVFDNCDYFIFIYTSLDAKDFYSSVSLNDLVSITGDITTGNANIKKVN